MAKFELKTIMKLATEMIDIGEAERVSRIFKEVMREEFENAKNPGINTKEDTEQ